MKSFTIEVTDICPLACKHCSTFGSWDREDNVISLDEFKSVLDQYPDFETILASGGEPFMHPQIIQLGEIAKSMNRQFQMLSCGVYRQGNTYSPIPGVLIQQCKSLVDKISFSLHGSKDTHEKVVGVTDTFQLLDETVNRLITERIPFSFGFVPIRTNFHDLEGAVEYVSTKSKQQDYCKPNLHLLRYVKQGSNQYLCDKPNIREELALTQEENQQIIEQAKALQIKYQIPVALPCSMLERGCTAGIDKKGITPYGKEYNCPALKWEVEQRTSTNGEAICKELH